VKRVVILASGSGTLAQAIFDARENELTDADIVAVISDKADAQVLDRALSASVESFVIPMLDDRSEWDTYRSAKAGSRCQCRIYAYS
jgi:phosphoribosylglycinamide formyltransferase-1